MDSIQSYNSAPDYSGITSASRIKPATFEANSKEYGPVVATVLSAGQALGEAASATYSFSAQGLSELENEGKKLYGEVSDGISNLVTGIEHAPAEISQALSDAGNQLAEWAHEGVTDIENLAEGVVNSVTGAAQYIGDALSDAATTVGHAISDVASEVGSVVGSAAGYVGMGVSAVSATIDELT